MSLSLVICATTCTCTHTHTRAHAHTVLSQPDIELRSEEDRLQARCICGSSSASVY